MSPGEPGGLRPRRRLQPLVSMAALAVFAGALVLVLLRLG
jgi:hypothetical protein